jgi:hypothetical protein
MAAVDELLTRLSAMDAAVDFISNPPASASQDVLDMTASGLAVAGLVAVESFLRSRAEEWVTAIGAARIGPAALPGGSQQYERRLIETLPRRFRDTDVPFRPALLEDVGRSLTSLTSNVLVPHGVVFAWAGSNIQEADVESLLAMLGVNQAKAWGELTSIWSRVDIRYPQTSAKSLFSAVATLRHEAAHQAKPNLPIANLASLSRSVRMLCLCIDALGSLGVFQLKQGSASPVVGSSTKIRKIQRDGSKWPEYSPGVRRAFRRHASRHVAVAAASGRSMTAGELLLVYDGFEILDWRLPAV